MTTLLPNLEMGTGNGSSSYAPPSLNVVMQNLFSVCNAEFIFLWNIQNKPTFHNPPQLTADTKDACICRNNSGNCQIIFILPFVAEFVQFLNCLGHCVVCGQ